MWTEICPHCQGETGQPLMVTCLRVAFVILALVLAFSFAKKGVVAGIEAAQSFLAAHEEEGDQPQPPPSSRSELKNGPTILDDWQYGCVDRVLYEKIMNYAKADDLGSFYGAVASAEEAEGCSVFVSGEEVYFSGENEPGDFVKIRRKAETEEYWTSRPETWKSMENIWR